MNAVADFTSAAGFNEEAAQARSDKREASVALLVVTFTTGLVDAVSYLARGRVFAGNMTWKFRPAQLRHRRGRRPSGARADHLSGRFPTGSRSW
jgi:hypothetical protein